MPKIWIAFLIVVPCLFVQGQENNCQTVGGAILTNFITETTTLGTATGDLKGGIVVDELSVSPGENGSTIIQTQPPLGDRKRRHDNSGPLRCDGVSEQIQR